MRSAGDIAVSACLPTMSEVFAPDANPRLSAAPTDRAVRARDDKQSEAKACQAHGDGLEVDRWRSEFRCKGNNGQGGQSNAVV